MFVRRGKAARHEKRAKPTVWKDRWGFRNGQQSVIASAQFRLTSDVECPLQGNSLAVRANGSSMMTRALEQNLV